MSDVILLGEYGSTAMGLATANSDHDLMGVYVPSQVEVLGLGDPKSRREADAASGERSQPGERDVTYHPLKKFVSLVAGGNPTVGSILYLPRYEVIEPLGQMLVDQRDIFVSKKMGYAYLGYMRAQIAGIEGGKTKTSRPELVEKYGYDTKFAYHALRLGWQGIDMLKYKRLYIPVLGFERSILASIRAGDVTLEYVMSWLHETESELRKLVDDNKLPDLPDYDSINALLVLIHEAYWNRK